MDINIEYIKASATEDIANQYIGKPDGYAAITGRCPVKEVQIQAAFIKQLLNEIELSKRA